ncbi:probable E3 ubiquitin-protein ligase MID2 [Liolophura sinensis]|uniref:probable E3 ubiquitin-protein ligase MID2 n=1 Tax=Liolophura sinensis TaxID=3198878 RepID=UPI003158D22C
MAASKQRRVDVLTCSICLETFRKPVVLPCQHSFCKECIGLYADKFKPVQIDETSGSTDVHRPIACPVCRAPTSLGREGVAGLAPNFHLAEIVERFTSAVKVEDDTPYCSLCKADNHTKAVKFCTTCAVFYCQECLANCHPMRGALKRHQLISSMEYLSQETSQGQVSRDHQSTGQPSCARHGQPFVLYCEPCGMVMCMGCVVEHPGHAMRDIPSAAGNVKLAVLCKTSELEKVLRETKESLPGVMRLQNKIQKNQELHFQEVEKAYCAALESLQAWRQQSIDGIKTRYSQWCVECNAILKHFQLQAQEMERMVQASKDFLASVDVEFLQGSTSFTKTIGDQLNEIGANLERDEVSKQNLQGFVQLDLVLPRHVTVKETVQGSQDLEAAVGGQMSRPKPTLRFTETDDSELRIAESGSVIEGDFLEGDLGRAVTNGRYQTGRYYWEIEITCSRVCGSGCDVGVTQESCGVRGRTDPGHNSWYIGMLCRGDEVRCYSHRGGEIKPGYLQGRRYTRPLRMGLYLDCDDQSLTVLDCHNNQVIGTVSGVVVTEPLVPWVEFYVWSGSMSASGSVSARLVTGDCSSASGSQ